MKYFRIILIVLMSIFLCESLNFAKNIEIIVGEAKIFKIKDIKKVAVGNSNIVDVKAISSEEILLSGKASGTTTVIVWNEEDKQTEINVTVFESKLEKAMIEVSVQVMEIRKSSAGDFGIDWKSALSAVYVGETTIPPLFNIGTLERLKKIETAIKFLVQKGYAKVLAKPRLLTVSGGKASFLSGGEIPIVYQDQQKLVIEYKGYGVNLDINPTADNEGNISSDLRAEVSTIDPDNGVMMGTSVIPALKTRWVKSSVFVKKGGTIVIAGLMHTEESKKTEGVPIISNIPLIGELFKSTHSEQIDTELVIFVTPSIVGQSLDKEEEK